MASSPVLWPAQCHRVLINMINYFDLTLTFVTFDVHKCTGSQDCGSSPPTILIILAYIVEALLIWFKNSLTNGRMGECSESWWSEAWNHNMQHAQRSLMQTTILCACNCCDYVVIALCRLHTCYGSPRRQFVFGREMEIIVRAWFRFSQTFFAAHWGLVIQSLFEEYN